MCFRCMFCLLCRRMKWDQAYKSLNPYRSGVPLCLAHSDWSNGHRDSASDEQQRESASDQKSGTLCKLLTPPDFVQTRRTLALEKFPLFHLGFSTIPDFSHQCSKCKWHGCWISDLERKKNQVRLSSCSIWWCFEIAKRECVFGTVLHSPLYAFKGFGLCVLTQSLLPKVSTLSRTTLV